MDMHDQHSIKAAVALSNTSVTLMERHSYRDAIITLRDALYLSRAAIPGDDSCVVHLKHNALQYALRKASGCLGRSFPVKQEGAIRLKVLSENQCTLPVVLRSMDKNDIVAIRIDDSRPNDDMCALHMEAAVILFNYGTACRCYHASCRHQNTDLLVEAYNVQRLAYGILAREFKAAMIAAGEPDICQLTSLALFMLHSLLQLCDQLRMPVQYSKLLFKYRRLSEVFSRLGHFPCWGSFHLAPAA